MKKFLSILLSLTLLLSFCTINVSAQENIKVIIDITSVKFDVPPTIVNGRTLVPLRAIFEALGATVDWNDATQTVTSQKDGTKISLTINSNVMTVNGEAKTLDVPATLIDSRTLVPVRAISEAFGLQVGWDGEANIVSIVNNTDSYQLLYATGGRSRVFAKSSVAKLTQNGWYEGAVTTVYSSTGKEKAVPTDEVQSYLDSGYYAYPVKTVYTADGSETVIVAEEFDAYIANGYLAEKPVVQAPVTDTPAEGDAVNKAIEKYRVYGDVSEENLTIQAVALFVKTLVNNASTSIKAVYGGFYNEDFIAVADIKSLENGKWKEGLVTIRLETNSTMTPVYGAGTFFMGVDSRGGFTYDWAGELATQRKSTLTDFTSDAVIEKILEIGRSK